jgi:SAM-dependent methyltransferase
MAHRIGVDRHRLARLLRNGSDMAFKQRVSLLTDYLELRERDRILDCGCGMGFYLKPLRFAGQELRDGAALVRGDILALPYATGHWPEYGPITTGCTARPR